MKTTDNCPMPFLNGQQNEQLTHILVEKFPDWFRLEGFLSQKLDKRLAQCATPFLPINQVAFKVIEAAEAEDWILDLIQAVYEARRMNAEVIEFAQQFGLCPFIPDTETLEAFVSQANKFDDSYVLHQKLAEIKSQIATIEGQICYLKISQINQNDKPYASAGTGFLISPNLLMTNYHVVEAIIMGEQGKYTKPDEDGNYFKAQKSDVKLYFDYRRSPNGKILPSKEYSLADDWLVDYSPSGELDYAILRVANEPGKEVITENDQSKSVERGWITIPQYFEPFTEKMLILILQHPVHETTYKPDPLKYALGNITLENLNSTPDRINYQVDTLGGSSGSPCFYLNLDTNLKLVALHKAASNPQYNVGVPINKILENLKPEVRQLLTFE